VVVLDLGEGFEGSIYATSPNGLPYLLIVASHIIVVKGHITRLYNLILLPHHPHLYFLPTGIHMLQKPKHTLKHQLPLTIIPQNFTKLSQHNIPLTTTAIHLIPMINHSLVTDMPPRSIHPQHADLVVVALLHELGQLRVDERIKLRFFKGFLDEAVDVQFGDVNAAGLL
jgi:hypothetical protein